MIRLVFIFVALVLLAAVAFQLFRSAKSANLDWTGITFAIGFVALAFYLRHLTQIG